MATRPPHGYFKHVCTATARSGKPCGRPAIPGGTVCRYHGGAAPQVQARARERLAAMVDPALSRLEGMLRGKKTPLPVVMAAVKDILDRNGFKPKNETELTGKNGKALTIEITGMDLPEIE